MGFDWVALLRFIAEKIQECQNNNQPAQKIAKRIRRFGPAVAWRTRQGLRKQGLRGVELRQAMQQVREDVQDMDDSELLAFVADAPNILEAD